MIRDEDKSFRGFMKYCSGDEIQDEMGGACGMHGEELYMQGIGGES